jgi:hypothetical protein
VHEPHESLHALATLRKQLLERARLSLAQALDRRASLTRARRVAIEASARSEAAVRDARAAFSAAIDVRTLRRSATWSSEASREVARQRDRLLALERRLGEAHSEAELAAVALRDAQVSERALARTLERREKDVSRRTERRAEDDADDAFRAR